MSRVRMAAALAASLAASPAAAYVRTKAGGTGAEVFWPMPIVVWHLNRDWPYTAPGCEASAAGDPTFDAVHESFDAWQQPCADLRLIDGGASHEIRTGLGGSSDNIVVFRRGWCSQNKAAISDPCFTSGDLDCGGIYDCFDDACPPGGQNPCADWGTVALTSVVADVNTGRILDADIEVNGWDGVPGVIGSPPQHGWYFTCGDPPPTTPICGAYGEDGCVYIDLQNTVTHEAGHFVGLGHVPTHVAGTPQDSWSTMEKTTAAGETWKRSLSQDDIDGVCAIYPVRDAGCSCGSGGATGAISMLLAAFALRRRARIS